jgi:excinuclease ABC subunit C
MNTKKILASLKNAPGIYKMIDKEGKIIYIGKAKNIKKRVSQYFQKNYEHSTRTKKLMENVENIEFTTVDTELEAMILETNLIKQFLPKYNILMKDDKNYVYIKITKEDFPKIQIVRKVEKDGAKYIGPKTASHKVKETFKVLKKIFPFRHCNLDIKFNKELKKAEIKNKTIKYPCLDYYIKRCAAPCINKCSMENYQQIIKNVENFLKGKADGIMKDLKEKMNELAKEKKFENAAKIRDKIQKTKEILEKQKVADPNQKDKDIINYCINLNKAYFNLFQIRDGKLIGQENFILSANSVEENSEKDEILEAFLNQYYGITDDIPNEILIPHKIENKEEIELLLNKTRSQKTKIIIPQIGMKNKLLEMSLNNAKIFADRNKPSWQEESSLTEKAVKDLQKLLKLKNPLKRIECYDISHLDGTDTVGSMIVFTKGIPDKQMYRKFRLKTVQNKPDDYKSIEEVLKRRLYKIAEDNIKKEYIFKKALEKDGKKFQKKNKTFFTLKKNKKLAGYIAIQNHSDKINELSELWIFPKERGEKLGYKLLKNAIQKAKSKRVYGIIKEELKDYYFTFGFEEIKKFPKELESNYKKLKKSSKSEILCIVYDKNKHKPDKSFAKTPDLIIIDGGQGQLSTATKVLKELNLKIPHISLSKKLEQIHTADKKTILLQRNNEALKLLQRSRDEAHRFAINYNKKLRSNHL